MSELPKKPTKGTATDNPQAKIKNSFWELIGGIKGFFISLVDLREGLDKKGTIENIRNNKRMKGANAWLLGCSIMIASLGLDLDSQAVIIGAMLISPLMSPILGVGLAVGIRDNEMLRVSSKHFLIAIFIALFTSTIYFLLTPFGDFTPSINARTRPTLLDALVALFGGIAGIISGSRKDKSNAIPGVAIATALMPPLCVTGYGIANMISEYLGFQTPSYERLTELSNWQITINSFYLFFLNATLVALATFGIVKLLRFRIPRKADEEETKRMNTFVLLFSFILMIPSFFILRGVLKDINEERAVKNAMYRCFEKEMKYVDEYEISHLGDTLELSIKLYAPLLKKSLSVYKDSLLKYFPLARIDLIPTAEINLKRFQAVESKMDIRFDSIILAINKPYIEKSKKQSMLEKRIAELTSDTLLERQIEQEILALYGDLIQSVSYYHTDSSLRKKPPLLDIEWKEEASNQEDVKTRLRNLLRIKTGLEVKVSKGDE